MKRKLEVVKEALEDATASALSGARINLLAAQRGLMAVNEIVPPQEITPMQFLIDVQSFFGVNPVWNSKSAALFGKKYPNGIQIVER